MNTSKILVKILNEANSSVQYIDGFEFYASENGTLKIQLWHEANRGAYILAAGAVVTIRLLKRTGFYLEKIAVVDSVNRSIVTCFLTSSETSQLVTGRIQAVIVEGSSARVAQQESGKFGIVLLR